jgi:hypothetical protein
MELRLRFFDKIVLVFRHYILKTFQYFVHFYTKDLNLLASWDLFPALQEVLDGPFFVVSNANALKIISLIHRDCDHFCIL